jgi:hypothetical protein
MPIGMYRLSTATPPHQGNPRGFYELVAAIVDKVEGATLIDIYFDIGRDEAVVIIEGLDDYVDVKAVSTALGAQGFEKFVRIELAEQAIARHGEISS